MHFNIYFIFSPCFNDFYCYILLLKLIILFSPYIIQFEKKVDFKNENENYVDPFLIRLFNDSIYKLFIWYSMWIIIFLSNQLTYRIVKLL